MNAFKSISPAATVRTFRDRPKLVETIRSSDAQDDLTSAVDLCNRLRPHYDARLLWLEDDKWKNSGQANAVQLRDNDPDLLEQTCGVFDRLQPEIVHTHRLEELETVGRAARLAGVPYLVHSMHSNFLHTGQAEMDQFVSLVQELEPVLIAPNAVVAARLPNSVSAEIMPAGVDCDRYVPGDQEKARRRIGLPTGPKIIGCASPPSNSSHLFHALFKLEPNVHLALFGKAQLGPLERDLLRKLGLDERVHVLGAWARPEQTFQAIDVYFHGPSGEALPRAVLAAQACGKPVIACTPTPEETLCPRTGRLIPMDFKPTLLHNIRRSLVCSEPTTPRAFVLRHWDISAAVEGYIALFRRIIGDDERSRSTA